jgi:heptosyltransferase I
MSPPGRPKGEYLRSKHEGGPVSPPGRPERAVLVVRPSSLGDIVHALALVDDIRRHRPEYAIDWVAEDPYRSLVALNPGVRRIIPIAVRRWRHRLFAAATWREAVAFRRELRVERYAAILDLQEQVKGALITRMARGRRHGPDRTSIREPVATLLHDAHHAIDPAQHLIDRCRQLAGAALGYTVDGPPRFGIVPPPATEDLAAGRPYVVLVHATSRADKLWPEADWRGLIEAFAKAGYAALLPWGSADERLRSERLADRLPTAIVPPHQRLPALAGLLARAELVIGVDTGLVHLAAAVGTPTLALFTVTDPALAGVERASPYARDLGGAGRIPTLAEVQAAAGGLLHRAPRC